MTIVTEQIKLDYRLNFGSSFHFGTGLRRGLIHRTVARDHREYLIVPGTTIKGVVRERCEQLGDIFNLQVTEPHDTQNVELRVREARLDDPDIITRIFGSRFMAGSLFFDDAHLADFAAQENDSDAPPPPADAIDRSYFEGLSEKGAETEGETDVAKTERAVDVAKAAEATGEANEIEPPRYLQRQVETRTQVSLSRLTRTAKAGHLYTSEYGIRQLCFTGSIYGYLTGYRLPERESGSYSLLLLLAGLLSVDQIGGMKSTGAGQVEVQVAQLQINGQAVEINPFLNNLSDIELYWIEREENA